MHDKRPDTTAASPRDLSQLPTWPHCGPEQEEAVLRVMRSGKLNYWTGTEGREFEREFSDYVGSRHAIAVANGTVGLELALAVLGIGPGDEVIVPCRTFIATASAVVMRGAVPVCADVDRDSQNVTVDNIRAQLTPRTRAIIVVHLAGWPCEMAPILELATERRLWVIEDCAQSHGARYRGQHVGTLGDIGVFSFCQDKIITTGGEGGMLVTNHRELWNKAWSYKDHGKCYDAVHAPAQGSGFRWLHKSFGTNWRMTEMQSAIGRVALRQLDNWVAHRRRNADLWHACFAQFPGLRTPLPNPDCFHSYYKCYTFVRPEALRPGWTRDRILQETGARGVPCFSGSCSEIYLEDAFPPHWRPAERFATARELGETSLMFLVHPTLEVDHVQGMCQAAGQVLASASLCNLGAESLDSRARGSDLVPRRRVARRD
jgi:dTDP-4-amino-4,6-dideoxygalactose transaminase